MSPCKCIAVCRNCIESTIEVPNHAKPRQIQFFPSLLDNKKTTIITMKIHLEIMVSVLNFGVLMFFWAGSCPVLFFGPEDVARHLLRLPPYPPLFGKHVFV